MNCLDGFGSRTFEAKGRGTHARKSCTQGHRMACPLQRRQGERGVLHRRVAPVALDPVALALSDASALDPEEAFVASLSSCHMLWFLAIAARRQWCMERYFDAASGIMGKNAEGRTAMTLVTLRPDVLFADERQPTREELDQLHHEAHEACFIANSVRTEVRCEPVYGPA